MTYNCKACGRRYEADDWKPVSEAPAYEEREHGYGIIRSERRIVACPHCGTVRDIAGDYQVDDE